MTLRIRPLQRDDGDVLDAVMEGMSAQSRYQRYHGPKPRLTSGDRRYLTNVDEVSVFFREWRHLSGARLATETERRRGYNEVIRGLIASAREVLRANWTLLDGVERMNRSAS